MLGRDLIDLRAFDFAYHAGWLAGPGLWFCLLRAPCLLARARFDLLLDFAGEKDLCPVPWLLGRLRWPLGPTRRLLSLARCRRTADVARDTGLEDYESERSRVERRTSLRMLYRTNRFSGSGAQDETCRTRCTLDAIRRFYYSGADLDFPRPDGTTLLMEAAESYDVAAIAFLLEHGANPNAQDLRGRCALHHAVPQHRRSVLACLSDDRIVAAHLHHPQATVCTALALLADFDGLARRPCFRCGGDCGAVPATDANLLNRDGRTPYMEFPPDWPRFRDRQFHLALVYHFLLVVAIVLFALWWWGDPEAENWHLDKFGKWQFAPKLARFGVGLLLLLLSGMGVGILRALALALL